jgi:hypothetical protein
MTTDNKTAPVDVLQWLGDERFMYGPDTESRAKCEESRAAVAELIDKVDSYVKLGHSDTAYRELSAALARVKGV